MPTGDDDITLEKYAKIKEERREKEAKEQKWEDWKEAEKLKEKKLEEEVLRNSIINDIREMLFPYRLNSFSGRGMGS